MKRIICFSLLGLFLLYNDCEAQLLNSFGFKIGVAVESQKWEYNDLTFDNTLRPGLDFSVFLEWLNISHFNILTECHYIQRGTKCTTDYMLTAVAPNDPKGYIDLGYYSFTTRLDYLSFPLLAKYHFDLTGISLYLFAGPRIDFLISEHDNDNFFTSGQYRSLDIGGTYGIGIDKTLSTSFNLGAEFRYSPSYQKCYSSRYLSINNQSMEFLLVVGF